MGTFYPCKKSFCKNGQGHSTNPFNSSFDLLQVFGFRPTFFASILDYIVGSQNEKQGVQGKVMLMTMMMMVVAVMEVVEQRIC